jgi:hypothetical protein
MMRVRGPSPLRACVGALAAVWGMLLAAGSAHALSNADKQALASLALQWAVEGGIGDVSLLKEPTRLIVVDQHLPSGARLVVPDRTVVLLSPVRIQAQADVKGDFLYFLIGPFDAQGTRVRVPIRLAWAISVREQHLPHLSGGGAILEFEQQDGKWQRLPVEEQWSS